MFNVFILLFCFITSSLFSQNSEKPIVVVICSYNNKDWYERNLQSVLMQKYNNYQVLYIDDCSSDGTAQLVQDFLDVYDHNHRIHLIKNSMRRGALANHWTAVHSIPDDAIVVHLDGDDFFAHENVLTRINQEYQDPNVWMTYGQYVIYPSGQHGHCCAPEPYVIERNAWRSPMLLPYSHLRTFYAWLFKRIKLNDLLIKNMFFPAACDNAFMFPMLEMAGEHVKFIDEVLYVYNQENPLNDFKQRLSVLLACAQYIKAQKKYEPLEKKPSQATENNDVRLLLFSFDRPLQLYAFLESVTEYIKGLQSIYVLYRTSSKEFEEAYEQLKNFFPAINFVKQDEHGPHASFKQQFLELVFNNNTAEYILFGVDDIVVKDFVDLHECINYMNMTHAYGFFLRLGTNITQPYLMDLSLTRDANIPPYVPLDNKVLAWQFNCARHDWAYPNTLDMTLYRKKDIAPLLHALSYTTPNTLEGQWYGNADFFHVGLCFMESKVVNIPLNMVQETTHNQMFFNNHRIYYDTQKLLDFFNAGLKLAIKPLHHYQHSSAHIDYEPTFIGR